MISTDFSPNHHNAKVQKVNPSSLSRASRKKINCKRGTDYQMDAFDLLKQSTRSPPKIRKHSTSLLTSDESNNSNKNEPIVVENLVNEIPIIISDDDSDDIIDTSKRYFTCRNNDDIIVISDSENSQSLKKNRKVNVESDILSESIINSSIKENIKPSVSRSAKKSQPKFQNANEDMDKNVPLYESKTNFIENWLQNNHSANEDSQSSIEKDGSDIDAFKNILLGYYSNTKSSLKKKNNTNKKTTSNVCRKKLIYKENEEQTKENIIAKIDLTNSPNESVEDFHTFSANVHKQLESTRREIPSVKKSTNYRTRKLSFSSESDEFKPPVVKESVKKKERKIKTRKEKASVTNFSNISSLDKNTLSSFSDENPNEEASYYIKNFKKLRQELSLKLFNLFNKHVFENKLPMISIEWNNRMQSTAGFCYNRRGYENNKIVRSSRIQLSSKVIDNPSRLRDTLLHEMCHAASWIISEVRDGHGYIWNSWASLAGRAFPEIPPVMRCHNYVIKTKYTYRCKKCGYSFGRQLKSVDITKKRCGKCYGEFEILVNSKKSNEAGSSSSTLRTPRAPSAFALFVKENYAIIKQTTPGLKHAEVMKELSQQFALLKTK